MDALSTLPTGRGGHGPGTKIPIAWIGIGGIGFRSQGELNTRCMVHRDPDVSPSQQAVELGSQATSANFISALANYGKYDKGVVKAFQHTGLPPRCFVAPGEQDPATGWAIAAVSRLQITRGLAADAGFPKIWSHDPAGLARPAAVVPVSRRHKRSGA